uniref:Uncharacterized protein n=1 Tax=Kalanchoe fedtschenkoi TaxID=63787 RepID=A0A7N0U6F6_KALFE
MESDRHGTEIERLGDEDGAVRMSENGEDWAQDEAARTVVPWRKQITARGLVASLLIGVLYSVITAKLSLTTGLIPNLNVSVGLLAFVTVKTWTGLLHKAGIVSTPFTRQENTVVQTCAVACYTMTFAGGFGSYLLALNKKTYEQAGVDTPGNVPGSYKEPAYGWMAGFLFVCAFVGLFALVPLRKALIIDYKLPYPTGVATAVLINGFHSDRNNEMAKKQVKGFVKYTGLSFLWSFFQWFFSGDASSCGFAQFPTFGLKAFQQTFFFDFSLTYVGAGMICPHIVNLSLLIGAVLSWGLMWPLIADLKGKWYPAAIPSGSMRSLTGYKVFVSIALILGDGLYNFLKILYFTGRNLRDKKNQKKSKTFPDDHESESAEERKLNELFMRERIPVWVALVGYAALSAISIIVIPLTFPELKWYYCLVAYIIAPALGFCNAYGAGLTDMNMGYNYGKAALFVLAALSGHDSGVVAGLIGCGLIKSIASSCSDLMHDFKTGQLTLTSPRSMFVSQTIGTAMGCVVAPGIFLIFYKAFDVGNPAGEYKAPYALIYRNMAIIGVQGFGALPDHCLHLCYGFFAFAVVLNLAKDFVPSRVGKWVPVPMAMAVPFLVGANFAIDMCIGSVVVLAWDKLNKAKAKTMVPAVASGLICGDGMWLLPSALLALAGLKPPICMKFLPNKSA